MKLDNFLLSIDGGGSKTEFLVTDFSGNELHSFILQLGCNPNYGSIEETQKIITMGIEKLPTSLRKRVLYCYAGISGCHRLDNSALVGHLETMGLRAIVSGDIYSSFRANSISNTGFLAIAGTGATIAHISSDHGAVLLDEPALGGRGIGFVLSRMNATTNDNSAKKSGIEKFRAQIDSRGTTRALMEYLSDESGFKENPQIFETICNIWVYKISSFILRRSEQFPEASELVLAGGLWKSAAFRENTLSGILEYHPNLYIVKSIMRKPVWGGIVLLREAIEKEKMR